MAGTITRGMPSVQAVGRMIAAGTAGATGARISPVVTVSVPYPQSTASAGTADYGWLSWVNPESGTIIVTDFMWYPTNTATGGTLDVGVSADGTGSNDNIVDGGTINSIIQTYRAYRGLTGTQGGGTLGIAEPWILGPGGTGTNNSIVGKFTEVTSTAVGRVFITYVLVG